ncbi:unnamed protein product [Trypanosoma congolense IL3000]|uniref:WGS project CAEQ00000000 data, annotated contig 714 n=1 Tax=Trypanosoma congolense (strain IL3000) TaxID=1068625 RepID=F9WI01_TRYCI|nr:unnamed protein product [Trypanosoma congolense IL3000]
MTILSSLVRQAYRSLHFYDAGAASCAVAALGDLQLPPRNVLALVSSLLAVLPGMHDGAHVAHLLQGLSKLGVCHHMLTAHLLKRYLRCFRSDHAEVRDGPEDVGCVFYRTLGEKGTFIASFASVLRTLCGRSDSLQFIHGLFLSLEEILEGNQYAFPVCSDSATRVDTSCLPGFNALNGDDPVSHNSDSVAEGRCVALVLRFFVLVTRSLNGDGVCLPRVDAFLKPLSSSLPYPFTVDLLCNVGPIRNPNTARPRETMCGCHVLLVLNLVQHIRSDDACLATLSQGDMVRLLHEMHRCSLQDLSQVEQRELTCALSVMRSTLESAPLSPSTIRRVAEGDLIDWCEMKEKDGSLTPGLEQRRGKVPLRFLIDTLYKWQEFCLREERAGTMKGENLCQLAETLVTLCHFGFMGPRPGGSGADNAGAPSFLRLCDLSSRVLGALTTHVLLVNASLIRRLHVAIKELKVHLLTLLHSSAENSRRDCALFLLKSLEQYEIFALSCFIKNEEHCDDSIVCLGSLLQGPSSREGTVLRFAARLLPILCSRETVTSDSIEHLVKLLRALVTGPDNGHNRTWWEMVTKSKRLSAAVRRLRTTQGRLDSTVLSVSRLSSLLSLLNAICPVERCQLRGESGVRVTTVRLPLSQHVVAMVAELVSDITYRNADDSQGPVAFGDATNGPFKATPYPVEKSVAERCALQSHSSDSRWENAFTASKGAVPPEGADVRCAVKSAYEHAKYGRGSVFVDLSVWLGAFRYEMLQRSKGVEGDAFRLAEINMHELKQCHLEVLRVAARFIRCGKLLGTSVRRAAIRAFFLELQCEQLEQGNSKVGAQDGSQEGGRVVRPLLMNRAAYLSNVSLLVGELFHILSTHSPHASGAEVTVTNSDLHESCTGFLIDTHAVYGVDCREIISFLSQFLSEFKQCRVISQPLRALHDIVWGSLTHIGAQCAPTGRLIRKFRLGKLFCTGEVLGSNGIAEGLLADDVSSVVVFASNRNTLLWSLLLLACFLRHEQSSQRVNAAHVETISEVVMVVARIVLLVSNLMPVLRRSGPAPETFVALNLREALGCGKAHDSSSGASVTVADGALTRALDAVLQREEELICHWGSAFHSVAARLRRSQEQNGVLP